MATEEITLYLAPWQKRIMKDFLSRDLLRKFPLAKITRVIIKFPKRQCLASYKIPALGIRRDDWLMYLTDEQMNILGHDLGLRVPNSSINITAEGLANGNIRFA